MMTPDMVSVVAEAIRNSRTELVDPPPGEFGRSLAYTTPEHQALAVLDAINAASEEEEEEVCPFDCDSCHGDGCPCDRLGCEGYDDE